jgi:hypothetical protein
MKPNHDLFVRLIPKTAKGKQRIKAHGDFGAVVSIQSHVQFNDEVGGWLLVEAADPTSRWVHKTRDKDFTVMFVNENNEPIE